MQSAKYLGVLIDSKLSWNTQCSALCKKANSTLAFLQLNFHSCPKDVKEQCFNTFVRSTLEYGCSVWDPHKTTELDSLEKINERDLQATLVLYTASFSFGFSIQFWSFLEWLLVKNMVKNLEICI